GRDTIAEDGPAHTRARLNLKSVGRSRPAHAAFAQFRVREDQAKSSQFFFSGFIQLRRVSESLRRQQPIVTARGAEDLQGGPAAPRPPVALRAGGRERVGLHRRLLVEPARPRAGVVGARSSSAGRPAAFPADVAGAPRRRSLAVRRRMMEDEAHDDSPVSSVPGVHTGGFSML
ncbi:MAG: hypothetical protein BJ554DRAFT_5336, partial [Olpidium bornovanus]